MTGSSVRLTIFLLLLLCLALLERRWPRHAAPPQRYTRWPVNFGLAALYTACLHLLMPWLAVDAAIWSQNHAIGILHVLRVPPLRAAIIAIAALDLAIYVQHRLMHRVGILWRLHRVHHSDLTLDVSSGVRFHPLEIFFSLGIKSAAVVLLGIAPIVVLAFEVVLSSFALLTHANVALPIKVERVVRKIFVTSDMHRIHHSVALEEHDSNFGFHVSWWDRLFGTYTDQPRQSQIRLDLGLAMFRTDAEQQLLPLLYQPFRRI